LTRLECQLEVFRGQMEELQGKMQQLLSRLEGPRGAVDKLRGRGLEIRGRARQTMARSRMSFWDLSSSVRRHPESYAPYGGLLVTGVAIVALAIIWPRAIERVWGWVSRAWPQPAERPIESRTYTEVTT